MKNPYVLGLGAFLFAWQAANFEPTYQAVLAAICSGLFGYATPKKK